MSPPFLKKCNRPWSPTQAHPQAHHSTCQPSHIPTPRTKALSGRRYTDSAAMVLLSEAAGGGSGTISRSRWPTRSSALAETPPCLDDSRHASSEQPRKKPIQLSWPDANDERRAKVGNSPSSLQGWRATDVRGDGSKAAVHIVNVSQDDLERHYALSDAVRDGKASCSLLWCRCDLLLNSLSSLAPTEHTHADEMESVPNGRR